MAIDNVTENETNSANPFAAIDWDSLSHDDAADSLFGILDNENAILTEEQVRNLEQKWIDDTRNRRLALYVLTKPFSFMAEQVQQDKSFAEAIAALAYYTEEPSYYQGIVDLLKAVSLRAQLALCSREDMEELLAKAEAQGETEDNEELA